MTHASAGLLNPSAYTEAAWDFCRNGLVERLVVQSTQKFYQLVSRATGTAQLADEGVHIASSDIRIPRRATVESDHLCECLKCSALHVGRGEGEISQRCRSKRVWHALYAAIGFFALVVIRNAEHMGFVIGKHWAVVTVGASGAFKSLHSRDLRGRHGGAVAAHISVER